MKIVISNFQEKKRKLSFILQRNSDYKRFQKIKLGSFEFKF